MKFDPRRTNESMLICVGIGIGVGGSILSAGILAIVVDRQSGKSFYAILSDWQTLLGAILALFGALLAVSTIHRQIHQSELQFNDGRIRKLRSARSRMAFALTEISDSIISMLAVLREENSCKCLPKCMPKAIPERPDRAINTICDCLEASDPPMLDNIAYYLENIQVFISRMENYVYETRICGGEFDENGHAVLVRQGLELYQISDRLFGYARQGTVCSMSVNYVEIKAQARRFRFSKDEFPRVFEELELLSSADCTKRA